MTTSFLLATEEVVNELPLSPVVIGVGTFSLLIVLLLITWAFRKG
jgi:hypothetical protein